MDYFETESEVVRFCNQTQQDLESKATSDSLSLQQQRQDFRSPVTNKPACLAPAAHHFELTPQSKELMARMLDENSPFLHIVSSHRHSWKTIPLKLAFVFPGVRWWQYTQTSLETHRRPQCD